MGEKKTRPRTDETAKTKSEKKVEKRTRDLSEIESLVSSLIDGSTDSIITTDINGIIKSWNKGAEEIFGHNAEDMVGKYIGVIYPPELKDERKGWQKKIVEGETIRNQRTKIYNSADELVDINLTLSPLKDKDGKLVGTIGIAKDITHVIKAEEALLESEKRYRELFDNSLNGVALHNIVTDENGIPVDYIFLEANTSFEKLTGLKVKDIIGKRVTEVIPDIEETSLIKTYGEVALTGNPIEFEQYVPQLERHYAITAFSPRKGQFAAVFSDITERKQAEQALRESEEKFRGLAEKSPNMIFINKKGRVIFANEKCEEMMGYTREEFYSPDFDFMALIVPEHRELIMRTFQRHMKGEEVEPYEYTLVTKDCRRIDVIQTTRLIQSEGETAILGMLTDITARKKAEESMKWQLMKFRIEKGNIYLVKETKPTVSRDVYLDLINCGFSGTILSRRRSEDIKEVFGEETEVFWIAEKAGEKIIAPDLEEIESLIEKLPPGNNVVFLDRLDYLIVKNGFDNTLRFIQNLNELFYLKRWVLLIALDINTLGKREMGLLENETNPVKPRHSLELDEDIYEILKYVYKEGKAGRKPAYSDVGLECGITKQTTRKRIEILKGDGYLIDKKKGRYKILELTEKGKYLF